MSLEASNFYSVIRNNTFRDSSAIGRSDLEAKASESECFGTVSSAHDRSPFFRWKGEGCETRSCTSRILSSVSCVEAYACGPDHPKTRASHVKKADADPFQTSITIILGMQNSWKWGKECFGLRRSDKKRTQNQSEYLIAPPGAIP